MSKILYTYLPDKNNFSAKSVANDYSPQTNETFIEPVNADGSGINLPVTFDGMTWKGADEPQVEIIGDPSTIVLSDADKAIAALTLQLAQNKADQDMVNAQLLLATAQQTAKETN